MAVEGVTPASDERHLNDTGTEGKEKNRHTVLRTLILLLTGVKHHVSDWSTTQMNRKYQAES